MIVLSSRLLLLPLFDLPQPVSFLDLLGLGQGHQRVGVGGGLVQRVPPTSEVTTSSKSSASAVHRLDVLGGVDQLEGGLVLVMVVGVLRTSGSVLGLVLGHVPPVLVGGSGPVGDLAQAVRLGEGLVRLKIREYIIYNRIDVRM